MLLAGALLHAQNDLTVSLNSLQSDDGMAYASLFNSESTFLKEGITYKRAPIVDGTATFQFRDLPDGAYAISCFHDEDGDGELTMNMGVIPAEPYGISNNAKGIFGPPKWEDAKFLLADGERKTIQIKAK